MFQLNLNRLSSPEFQEHPYRFRIIGGYLEKVLEAPAKDLKRVYLVWGNHYFGPGRALRIRRSHSVNTFMGRHPEEIDCLRDLVHFPKSHLAMIDTLKTEKERTRASKRYEN